MLGKVFGGFVGWLLGVSLGWGLLGLIGGIYLGARFDRALQPWIQRQGVFFGGQAASGQTVFFTTTFEVMGCVAKSDGRVSQEELAVAKQMMADFQLSSSMREEAIRAFGRGKASDFDLEAALQRLQKACWHQPILLNLFVEFQHKVARAEGAVGAEKQRILAHIHRVLGAHDPFADFAGFHGQRGQHQRSSSYRSSGHDLQGDYQALGVTASASDAEVKKAYRRLMAAHHPDRLVAKGLPESMIKLGTEKAQRIQRAYSRIKKARAL